MTFLSRLQTALAKAAYDESKHPRDHATGRYTRGGGSGPLDPKRSVPTASGYVEWWYDKGSRAWWAAKFDHARNQQGDAVHAYTEREIKAHAHELARAAIPAERLKGSDLQKLRANRSGSWADPEW